MLLQGQIAIHDLLLHHLYLSATNPCLNSSSTDNAPRVFAAREYRTKRVREARDEAKKEIDTYRKSKEDEFKNYENGHTSGNKKAQDDADKEAETSIKEIKAQGKKGQDKVVVDLLKAVFEVKPVPPSAA